MAAAQRDPHAFGPLYRRYLARVYRYVRAHMPGEDEAADITQQVFLQALDALPRYSERGVPFAAWLFRIARHTVADTYRRRRATVALETLPTSLHPVMGQEPEADLLRPEPLAHLPDFLPQPTQAHPDLLPLPFARPP